MAALNLLHIIKQRVFPARLLPVAFFVLTVINAQAQGGPTGPEYVQVGETHTYTYTDDVVFFDPNWQVTGGSITNTWQSGINYNVSVYFNTGAGMASITFRDGSYTLGYLEVTVDAPAPPTPNTAFSITYNCGNTVVTRNSSPPYDANYDWWWQTSSSGTSTSLGYGNNITRTTTGGLWLRSRLKNPPYTWSASSQSVGTATVYTSAPPAPAVANHASRFGPGALTVSVGTVSGALSYVWYLQGSGGTPIAGQTTSSYAISNLTTTTTYFVASKNGCESSGRLPVTGTILPQPTIVTTGTNGNSVTMGQNVTLATSIPYSTYSWRNSANTVVGTASTFNTTTPDNYTVIVTQTGVSNNGTSPQQPVVAGLTGLNMNYILTNTILANNITDPASIPGLVVENNNQSVQYFDGLGRPIQTVTTQGSPLKKDLVQPIIYDAFGREHRKYLPVVSNASNGWFKNGIIDANGNFAGAALDFFNNPSDKIADDPKPFAETVFEASPLNRVLKQGAPGLAWQPDATNTYSSTDRTIKNAYELNTANEVLRWTYTPPVSGYPFGKVNVGTASAPVYYAANQLYKNKTKDEQHNEVIEYKDKSNRTVLKKVQSGASQYASTYYLYDDLGQLVCVIPPEAVNRLATEYHHAGATDATKDTFLRRWAFRYKYDHRRRMTLKHVPGADSVRMVYDNRDRLVLTQDANQRTTNRWSFTKYDELNRPILTGIKDTTVNLTQAVMQSAVNAHFAKASARWGESYVGNAAGNVHGYTNRAYPVRTGTTTSEIDPNKYLTATYYDNYTFRSTWVGSYGYVNEGLSEPGQGITYTQPTIENTRVIGQVTGSKVKVLDGGPTGGFTWLKSVTYYDDKYRIVQTIADNYKGGTDRVTNVVDFVGKVLESRMTHTEADFVWTSPVSLVASGNILRSTATTSGAASVQQLAAGQNGWIEAIYSENNTTRFFGLNDTNPDAASANIDYAFRFTTSGTVNVVENGTTKATITGVAAGDVFRITRTGTAVTYTRNGNPITLSPASTASSTLLMADLSLATVNATLVGLKSSFSTTTRTTTRRFEYDHTGRLLRTWHKIDAQPEILLALNEYNELGQLVDKKLHSTVANGSNAKQSVDYRYNIRGWLTSMNNARLANEAATNDDANDLFGMELGYESTLSGLGNTGLFNGNISGMKYSSYGNGPIKEKGYTYTYDALNRLKTSQYRQRTGSVPTVWETATNQWAETGFNYDLNGNIINLRRNETATNTWMDDLTYTYTGNQLLRVTDAGDDFAGFLDGQPGTGNDYTYDLNGNMTRDLNKGIGTSLTDATNLITYNFLNLPETVTKGTNSVRYIYDATGRKLTQVTTFGSQQKQTDYAGEFIYENDALQFINHEEGRIAVAATKMVYTHDGVNTTGITAATSTLAPVTLNGQKYIRATAVGTTARQGMFPIGGTITVAAGEQYRIRAKGYRAGSSAVHLLVRANATDINWPGATLPSGSVNEAWAEQIVTIPSGATTLQAGVVWNTVTAGQQFFLNDFEITRITSNAAISTNLIANGGAESLANFIPTQSSTLSTHYAGTESYLKVTCNQASSTPGFLSGDTPVVPGKKYLARLRGYRSANEVTLFVVSSNFVTTIDWLTAVLPSGAANENWISSEFTVPANITSVKVGALWSLPAPNETMFINDVQLFAFDEATQTYPQTGSEYQYHLKDHLGNVRLSFTSKDDVDEKKATLEASTVNADRAAFLKYDDARRVYSAMFDYTNGTSPGYAQRLSGTATEKLGLARSLALMPGDKLKVEVYAKYFQVSNTDAAAFNSWVAAFISGASVPASVLDGAGYTTNTGNSIPYTNALNKTGETGTAPMAYLNWIVYDKNFLPIPALSGYRRITTNAQQGAGADVGHEKLESPLIDITQPGYAYIWLSNENATPVEVYFDDFKVTHTKSPVIQAEEYYPFGLTFNSYSRENSLDQKYLYNGKEEQDELGLAWLDYGWRHYDPTIARWMVIDPLAEKFTIVSPYAYALNNPLIFIDPNGLEVINAYASDFEASKNRFDKAKADVSDKKRKEWSKEQRKEFKEAKREYNEIKTKYIAVENAISDLKNTDDVFFNELNTLTDAGGNTVNIYVEVKTNEQQAKQDGNQIYGTTEASPNDESGYARTRLHDGRQYYIPYSSYGKGTIKVTIPASGGSNAPGRMFAHEGGHAAYLSKNLFYYYRVYLEANPYGPKDFEIGHRPGDPNGEAAQAAERQYDARKRELYKNRKKQ